MVQKLPIISVCFASQIESVLAYYFYSRVLNPKWKKKETLVIPDLH